MKTKSPPQSQAFHLIDTLIRLSPNHKKIARLFYLWMKSWKSGKMNGLHMGIAYIAKMAKCSDDTVYRFLEKYPYLVQRIHRPNKTNRYLPQETFIHSMEFMDANGMFEKNRRQQKTWYMKEMRKDLAFLYENVQICDPKCPNLRPNPLLIPKSYKHLTSKGEAGICHGPIKEPETEPSERLIVIPDYIKRLSKLPHELKLKLSLVPEGVFEYALEGAKNKANMGLQIKDKNNYVVGSAIRIAQKRGISLDWIAYYASLKKYKSEISSVPI